MKTNNSFFGGLIQRRQLLQASLLAPIAGCGGGKDSDRDPQIATTSSGAYRGQINGNVVKFLGVPYAQAPVGSLRFQSPRPISMDAVGGVKNATSFGPASLQTLPANVQWIYPVLENQSEDCLYVNVWAPVNALNAPVLVILHGGAWRTGSPSMPLFDGQSLADKGLIVVTVGFRLGALGSIAHPDLKDTTTDSSSNWQLQDQMAALKWVYENINAFGGDPSNITLMGQSAGGTSAALVAQNPLTRRYVRKVILLSPASNATGRGFNLNDAAAYAELLASRLGTTVLGLRNVPAATLHAAELALNAVPLPSTILTGKGGKVIPIVDGKYCLSDWSVSAWPVDMPVIIVNTLSEGTFFVDLIGPTGQVLTAASPSTNAQLVAATASLAGVSTTLAARVVEVYLQAAVAEGRPTDTPLLWAEIYGDVVLRRDAVRYADRLAAAGNSVFYATYAHTLKPPARGVPHCAELPFIFGTYALDFYKNKVGTGPAETSLSQSMQAAIASFVKDVNALTINGKTSWPPYVSSTRSSVRFGEGDSGEVVVDSIPKLQQLSALNSLLGT